MKKIALFSSDSTTLYKKDVFRIMGLQNEFIMHFRYGIEHLSMTLNELQSQIGSRVLIFFTHGNDLTQPQNPQTVGNIPLREAEIVNIVSSEDTGLVHIYLNLKDFKKCDFSFPDPAFQTPNRWVTEIDISNENQTSWNERVKALKPYFVDQLFYKIDLFDKSHQNKVVPAYSSEQNMSYYELSDESNYLMDIAFFDTSTIHSTTSQKLEISSEDKVSLKINAPQIIDVGARRDNRTYSLYTQSLASQSGYTYLDFKTISTNLTNLENDIQLAFEITKNKVRAIYFSLYTILAAISVGYSKLITDKWDINGTWDNHLFFHSLIALAIGFFSFYKLYQLFNKR